jgi:hypothetical protein
MMEYNDDISTICDILCALKITNMMMVQNFDVIFDKDGVIETYV